MKILVTGCGRGGTNLGIELIRAFDYFNTTQEVEDRNFFMYDMLPDRYATKLATENKNFTISNIDLVMQRNPDLSVLFITRHPIDVCLSKIVRGRPRSLGGDSNIEQTAADGTPPAAVMTIKHMTKIYTFLKENYSDRTLTLKMEDLIRDPKLAIKLVAKQFNIVSKETTKDFFQNNRNTYQQQRYGKKLVNNVDLYLDLENSFEGYFSGKVNRIRKLTTFLENEIKILSYENKINKFETFSVENYNRWKELGDYFFVPKNYSLFHISPRGPVFLGEHVAAMAAKYMRPDTIILDVGTNMGYVSSELLRYMSLQKFNTNENPGELYGFEVNPDLCKLAKDNLNVQWASKKNIKFKIFNYGIADKDKEIDYKLYYNTTDLSGGGCNIYGTGPGIQSLKKHLKIPAYALDNLKYLFSKKIGILKIDVEGGELDVLKGSKRILQEDNPVLIIEFLPDNISLTTEIKMFLENYGYKFDHRSRNDFIYIKKDQQYE